ncbi:MAG TPA: nucleotidyltransferase domain-containing protein [Gammaproteobacteria bacterium]|nr:nucleotidyltransferase domain-containing protein [Xanthomonadales bacterium]HPI96210.1 nucleotidyltransferase domain-containing protein [Gammaproteobacteria bacterium]
MDNQLNTGEALFTKTQQKVLGLLFGQPERSFYLNELIHLAAMGKGTVRRELDKLQAAGLLTVSKQGNQVHYQANSKHPIFAELKSIVKKTFGVVGTIQSALKNFLQNMDYAFIYGSVAKGKEHAGSDIDLMVVSDSLSYTVLLESLEQAEKQLGRSIHPTLYSSHEFRDRIENNQSFVTRVLSQNKLWLKGESQFNNEFDV